MKEDSTMENKLLHIYPSRCTACRNCEIACSFYHASRGKPTPSRIAAFLDEHKREGRNNVVICMQCDSAACVSACPAGALWRDAGTGAVVHVAERCVRCASCVAACPFGNMHWDALSDYPVKCDLCGGDPLCAKFCPTGALIYR
jgi:carbon-monoxide dehydrogenase iron sulfur subunit